MSEVQKAIEQMHVELAQYKAQRDQLQINLQQCVGAIYATEKAIEKMQACEPKAESEQACEKTAEAPAEQLEEEAAV